MHDKNPVFDYRTVIIVRLRREVNEGNDLTQELGYHRYAQNGTIVAQLRTNLPNLCAPTPRLFQSPTLLFLRTSPRCLYAARGAVHFSVLMAPFALTYYPPKIFFTRLYCQLQKPTISYHKRPD